MHLDDKQVLHGSGVVISCHVENAATDNVGLEGEADRKKNTARQMPQGSGNPTQCLAATICHSSSPQRDCAKIDQKNTGQPFPSATVIHQVRYG
jgi:hypothetical protein